MDVRTFSYFKCSVLGKVSGLLTFHPADITMTQGLAFVADMKLGHYLKLPPRTMFFGQLIATVWSCLVQVAVFYCKYRVYNA